MQINQIAISAILASLAIVITSGCIEHDSTNKISIDPATTILTMGDSLTYGTGTTTNLAYPAQLSSLSGHPVVNAGIPGEISSEGLKRLPNLLDRIKPTLLILCHGGNDLLRRLDTDSLHQNLKDMIKLARSRDIEVLLVGVPSLTTFGLSVHPVYDQIAEEMDVTYVRDALSDLIKDPTMKSDRIHLNADGYKKLAKSISRRIQ